MKRRTLILFSILLLFSLSSGCGSAEESFVQEAKQQPALEPKPSPTVTGNWTCVYAQIQGEVQAAETLGLTYALTMAEDQSAAFTVEGSTMPGHWAETETGYSLFCYSKQYAIWLEQTGVLSMDFGPYRLTFVMEETP